MVVSQNKILEQYQGYKLKYQNAVIMLISLVGLENTLQW